MRHGRKNATLIQYQRELKQYMQRYPLNSFRIITVGILLTTGLCSISIGAPRTGVTFLAGARYDDLRMCVGSPAGVKGGPVGDVMAVIRYQVDKKSSVACKIPVMRPLLFGAAFKMLQFEPEFTLEYQPEGTIGKHIFLESGLGGSFHWGPDYTTERHAEQRENFFAAGPMISSLFGLRLPGPEIKRRYIGLKLFYSSLFSKARPRGTVFGIAIEGGFTLF